MERNDLSEVEKLHYLKWALSGNAAQVIAHLPTTNKAFQKAWKLLHARYENKRLNVQSHMDRIAELKPMKHRRASSLIKMTNIIGETQEALTTFGLNDQHYCFLLSHLVRLLDSDTRERWESSLSTQTDYPTLTQLTTFLLGRARTLEQLERMAEQKTPQTTQTTSGRPASRDIRLVQQKAAVHAASATQPTPTTTQASTFRTRTSALYPCALCSRDHFLSACPAFRDKNVEKRISVVKAHQLCVNCLGHHNLRSCRTAQRCKLCSEQHHTALHGGNLIRVLVPCPQTSQPATASASSQPTAKASQTTQTQSTTHLDVGAVVDAHATCSAHALKDHAAHALRPRRPRTTLLATARARVHTDLATQQSLVNQIRLRRKRSSLDVHGVGGARTSQTNGVVNITLHSNYRPLSVTVQSHVLTKVTTCLPSEPPSQPTLPLHLEKLNLADPQFLVSRPMDIILGADAYGQVIKPNIIRSISTPLIAQLSIFGRLVIGPLEGTQTIRRTCHQVTVNNTDRQLNEQECEDHFKTTHSRDSAGRYIVRLPLKLYPRALGNLYQTAHNCLQRTLRRLSKDAQYNQLYTKFMLEYEQLGRKVRLNNDSITSPFQYFLPHHGVPKWGSTTTALSVAFNGSSPTSSGYSLNDLLHTGPDLMLNIADLLIWIRRYKHLISAKGGKA
ncbi:uncharacterized protein LOC114881965 [Osmia bicornis bicornis]|uniref:uncharacterized protein LOC114881965 n=1 Tax=Osmia bicornis bicornis TaxID=1437191 RepID=UPI001EAF503B|nr:uncharacterized protein LOC114881965 [Osmia bicornis bicornis]